MRQLRNEIMRHGGDFIATGELIRTAMGGKWDNPTGAYNIALKERLVALSVADNWKEARKEWRATNNAWYIPIRDDNIITLPEHHQSHPHYCICGHRIAWHFEIENTENNTLEIVGSEHIGFWMVIRHLIENEGIPEDMITMERIQEWKNEAIKSMKAAWWWKEYGEDFEEWFSAVREVDLRTNVRRGNSYWDRDTNRQEYQLLIRKKAIGKRGDSDYGMASIVWRWNHPDNSTTAQINTTGFPNDRLWSDLMLFYFNLEKHQKILLDEDNERVARIEEIAEKRKREEAERIFKEEERQKARELANKKAAIERVKRQKLVDTALERTCKEWEIKEFTSEDGRDDWEKSFLSSIINRIVGLETISERQKNRTIKIINRTDEPATEKQLAYIRKLGGVPMNTWTKQQASNKINELKEEKK